MNNKEKYDIYNAFDSLTVPDEITKQKIFNSIIKKEKKKNIRFRNFAVPAAAVLMAAVNTGLIYNAATASPQPNISKNDSNIYTEPVIRATADISDTMTTKTSDYIIYSAASGTAASMENVLYSETTLPATTIPEIITSSETYIVTTPYIPETTPAVTTNAPITETSVPETEKKQGTLLPPVSDDLQNLFSEAYQLYKDYTMSGCAFCLDYDENNNYNAEEKDVIIDGMSYSLTSDKYFTTMQDVYDYFHKYFTDDYINKIQCVSWFKEYNGRIYTKNTAKGGIIGYSGHIYDIVSQSDNEIDIKATCYIINDTANMTDSLFFCEPDNPDDYDTIERDIVFRKENGVWLIDNISLMW